MNRKSLASRLIAALGLASGASAMAAPSTAQVEGMVAPSQAPAAWVAYAETVAETVSTWLETDNQPATAARAYIGAREASPDEPLIVKIWIDPEGRLSRLDVSSQKDAAATPLMREALIGRILTNAPPPEMRQPLHISLD